MDFELADAARRRNITFTSLRIDDMLQNRVPCKLLVENLAWTWPPDINLYHGASPTSNAMRYAPERESDAAVVAAGSACMNPYLSTRITSIRLFFFADLYYDRVGSASLRFQKRLTIKS